MARQRKKKSTAGSLIELVVIVIVAIGLALLIQQFVVKPYRIPSESMVPTLVKGQRVLVNRIGMNFSDPHVGQIVVFKPPKGAEEQIPCAVRPRPGQPCSKGTAQKSDTNFIKRIVAGPGDTISVRNGHVVLNGKLQKESFTEPCVDQPICNLPRAIKIPKGYYFMMGDNRGNSRDSRFWGPVPRKWIIGNAFFTYWPLDRIGFL